MGFVLLIVMGGIIGWLASMVMNRDASMGIFWNIVVGIIGSFIGNTLMSFLLGGGTIASWPPDWTGILGAFIGALVLLAILNLVQRGKVR
ncbi:MAG: GlsB/YeaQ/YmgE family stress response membrane protein [Erythrobacter sp.]|jgi:uncharacterized membrane protein YeaQ/YmgE (transglycosylase-associated protein family)|nr:GlsB/YeaQ/YmgE family stress response membrane protein [Erythrobacter sp.]